MLPVECPKLFTVMNASSTTSDDDGMLTLTLADVDDSARRTQSKHRTVNTTTSFDTFTHETSEHNEALSMPLALPTSPTLLPLTSSPASDAAASSDNRAPMLRYMTLDRPSGPVNEHYFQSENSTPGDFHTEMQQSNDEYRRLTDDIHLTVSTNSSNNTSELVPTAHVDVLSPIGASPSPLKSKKRKQGTNVSIDLQTKIRIIEVAEQYQYDPKSSNRIKQESSSLAGRHGKKFVNGIRLAEQFGLNKSTVSRILKRKEEFKKAYYKDKISGCSKHINKKSKFEKLNRLVENWFDMNREKNETITDTLIREVGKRYAEELGIEDFRGSNGWVRSLRNRKEHTTRSNVTMEEQEAQQRKKDNEAIERMRVIFPNGVKDMAGFFKDLSTYLEKGGTGIGGFGNLSDHTSSSSSSSSGSAAAVLTNASYPEGNSEVEREESGVVAEETLNKKMIESLRLWSQELMALELAKIKKRMKPRQAAIL